jgi:hypothetical protein
MDLARNGIMNSGWQLKLRSTVGKMNRKEIGLTSQPFPIVRLPRREGGTGIGRLGMKEILKFV